MSIPLAPARAVPVAARRAFPLFAAGALGLLCDELLIFFGTAWDIQWHVDVGPDTFFTAPHLLIYSGAVLDGITCLAVVLASTFRTRQLHVPTDPAVVPILWRTFWAPVGFVLGGTGAALWLVFGSFDQWWHRVYGFDVALDSPPHVGLSLADITAVLGCVTVFASSMGLALRDDAVGFPILTLVCFMGIGPMGAVVVWSATGGGGAGRPTGTMAAMTDTVAIALITALSTLTAAGLTGVTSAWLTSRQLRHQRMLAREERAAQWAARQRELRREVYEQLLARADAAYRVLDEGWTAARFTESSGWEAGFAVRRALDEVQVRVMLEGPEDVATHGAGVVRGVGAEFKLLRSILDAHPDAKVSASELDRAARTGAIRARTRRSEEFVAAARRALGGVPPAAQEMDTD